MKKLILASSLSLLLLFFCQAPVAVGGGQSQESAKKEEEKPTQSQLRKGRRTFQLQCQSCHGVEGRHPDENFNLADDKWNNGSSFEDIVATIEDGVPGTQMLGFRGRLSEEKIQAVAHYVRTLSDAASD